jgi:putative ubiquitin-RnfH superfamily antitoxin RatB of RatAB toxin-antitoxin module
MPLFAAPTSYMASNKAPDFLTVELVLATDASAQLVTLKLPPGSSVQDALTMAAEQDPRWMVQISYANSTPPWAFAVWNQRVSADRLLEEGDRIELLRPLIAQPKEDRRDRVDDQRAAASRSRWRPDARGPLRRGPSV